MSPSDEVQAIMDETFAALKRGEMHPPKYKRCHGA